MRYDVKPQDGIRMLVRGIYQQQKLRIQTGNRLVNHYLSKMGVEPGTHLPEDVERVWNELKTQYKRITDRLAEGEDLLQALVVAKGLICTEAEFAFTKQYFMQLESEKDQLKELERVVESHPVWKFWLKGVRGVGPLLAGVLLSELDFYKARYPSSFWKYCGLDVAKDGRGRGRYKDHLEDREYVNKEGKTAVKKCLTYNPFLKSKIMGVLTMSFLRSNSPYREVYDNYRHRLDNHPKHKDKPKAHKSMMARRYMAKIFLKDLFIVMCRLSGRKEPKPYEEAKLGIKAQHPTPLVPMETTDEED